MFLNIEVTSVYLEKMYLHSAKLNISCSDKECKCFPLIMGHTLAPGHSCSLLFLANLRLGSCNVLMSALELSIFVF